MAKCLAGEQTHVAWQERPVTAAAMVIVGSGIGLVIIATETEKQSVDIDREDRIFSLLRLF